MTDLIMLVDTSLAEVPVNILPLTDDTDFKTRETGITFDQAGMDLVWNFVTVGGATSQTAVTPTSGGNYDWAHQGDGMYTIEIPASGGASINNDTEGFGWFTGVCTGVLPWRGPVIQFSPANAVNSLVLGSDLLDVNLAQISEDSVAADNLEAEYDATGYLGAYIRRGTAQSGAASNIVLDSGASTIDEFYKYMVVAIVAGNGAGQARTITGYTGSSRQADVEPGWLTNPNSSSVFVVRSWDTGVNVRWFAEANVVTTAGRPHVQIAGIEGGVLGVKKNSALSDFQFLMVQSSDHVTPATGLTVTGQRSLNSGAFAAVTGSIAEVSNGIYQFDAAAGDTNGNTVTWRFSATGADDRFIYFRPTP